VQDGRQIFVQSAGSQSASEAFRSADEPKYLDDWSPNGEFFLFHAGEKPARLFVAPASGSGPARLLLEAPEPIDGAHFSPDGRWVAYQVNEAGVPQVWVASFPAFDQRQRVSPRGGGQAMWRRDGQELFYLTPAGRMMSVRVTRQPSGALDFAAPVELFQSPFIQPWLEVDQYSPSKDGQRFLFIRPRELSDIPITVIANWR
jgi:Tol biopolymer transport system component